MQTQNTEGPAVAQPFSLRMSHIQKVEWLAEHLYKGNRSKAVQAAIDAMYGTIRYNAEYITPSLPEENHQDIK